MRGRRVREPQDLSESEQTTLKQLQAADPELATLYEHVQQFRSILKLLKRSMYGRAKLALLRILLLAA
jgi:hypothetical protein